MIEENLLQLVRASAEGGKFRSTRNELAKALGIGVPELLRILGELKTTRRITTFFATGLDDLLVVL